MINFSIPTEVPFVPGYFYSDDDKTKVSVQDIVNNGIYIGTELGDRKAGPTEKHRYIYYIASLDSTPQTIDQYFIPENGHVYLLSSATATIGSRSSTSRSIPSGVIAYMKNITDSKGNSIIVAQRIDEGGVPAFCKSFGVGTVDTNKTKATQLDMRKTSKNGSNSKWSQLIQQNDIWDNIYSDWNWNDNDLGGKRLIENFNAEKGNYFYIWHLPKEVWDNWENVSSNPDTTPETVPEGEVAFQGSRYQATQWKGNSLAGASVPVFQPFTVRQSIPSSWLCDVEKNDDGTYNKIGRHWQATPETSEDSGTADGALYRMVTADKRYTYSSSDGYTQSDDGKYLLIEDDSTRKQPYPAYYLDLSRCTKYQRTVSGEGDVSYSSVSIIDRQTAYSYTEEGLNNHYYVGLSIDIGKLQTWQNLAPLTIWWRYLIRQYIKSTLNGTAIKTKYKDDVGWANNYMDVSLQSRAYTACFRADGTSGLNNVSSDYFNGKIYWSLNNFVFSLVTSSYTIQGSMRFQIGDYASGAGDPYLAIHELYTSDKGVIDESHLLPNVRIVSVSALILSNSTREAYSVTYSGSGNPSVSRGISPAVAAPRVIQVMRSTGNPADPPSEFNYGEGAGDQSVSAMYPSYTDFCDAHNDIADWGGLGILNWDEETNETTKFDHYCDAVTKVAEYYRAREEALYGYPNLPEDITEGSGLVE